MSGKKPGSVKGIKSKCSSELDEQPLKFKEDDDPYIRNISSDRPSKLKVELQTLHLSKQSENAMMETIKHIRGSDFSLKDRSSYRDQGENLSRQYWVDRGHLVVQGGIDYSAKRSNDSKTKENMNIYACSKLESYGFYKSHCLEALRLTDGDVGMALEVLLSQYFKLGLSFPFQAKPNNEEKEGIVDNSEILQQREEEKCALESIFDSSFEERIANRLWVLNLELNYLYDFYEENNGSQSHNEDADHNTDRLPNRKSRKPQEYCRFFAKGMCRYAQTCRFSHEQPVTTKKVTSKSEEEDRPLFQLEIRFPEGSQYPFEPALVYLTTPSNKFPPEARLRLTSRLLEEARICASNETPAVYTIVQLLIDFRDEMGHLLKGKFVSFLDHHAPLFPHAPQPVEAHKEEIEMIVQPSSQRHEKIHRVQLGPLELLREDGNIVRKFMDKQSDSHYKKAVENRQSLPAWDSKDFILDAVKQNQVTVISGETGCGKSTQVPQFLLDDWLRNWNSNDKKHVEIICTQPRRLSAIGVAERVADERAEKIGITVGYQIRLESKMSSSTRLLFCTTGILLRRLETESHLRSVSHIIVDEVHERSEESDFLLLILRDLLPERPDLKVILMSATLNAHLFCSYFKQAPAIEIPGRTFPVDQFFLEDIMDKTNFALEENSSFARKVKKSSILDPDDINSLECELELADIQGSSNLIPNPATSDEHLTVTQLYSRYRDYSKLTCKNLYLMDPEKINYDLIEAVITWIVAGDHTFPRTGSILIFLPGMAEISMLHDQLMDHPVLTPRAGKFVLVPLHSTLSSEEQAAVFKKMKPGVRKIVLSTNIAETSITIDDCVFVVDCGKMKEKRFVPDKNMESLELVWVSRANALQRKGRAGRVRRGVCIHLFTRHRYNYHFLGQPVPELHRVPLEQLILRIKTLPHFADKQPHFVLAGTLEPPPTESIDSALVRLKDVGALDGKGELTPLGRHLAALPVDVRIGKLMLLGSIFCCVDSALTIAACLNYKTPFVAPFNKKDQADSCKKEFATANSDQLTVLKAYKSWLKAHTSSRYAGQMFATENFLSWRTLTTLGDIKWQLLELLASIGFVPVNIGRRQTGTDNVLKITGSEVRDETEDNYTVFRKQVSRESHFGSGQDVKVVCSHKCTLEPVCSVQCCKGKMSPLIPSPTKTCKIGKSVASGDLPCVPCPVFFSFCSEQMNVNGDNNRVLAAILCAALYPNVVKVLTPEKLFAPSVGGAIPKDLRADELRFKTRDDGFVFIHPSSVNFTVTHFTSPYLVYQEKVKTSRVFIRDCSMVPIIPLILFSGSGLQVELHQGMFIIALEDGWIKFAVDTNQIAELLQTIRNELVALLEEKIQDPSLNLLTHNKGKMIIKTIIHLITQE